MKIRKHSGINQSTGRLKKGYKYSGKKLKSGLAQIVRGSLRSHKTGGRKTDSWVKKKRSRYQRGGELDREWTKKQIKMLQKQLKVSGPKYIPVSGMDRFEVEEKIRKLTRDFNRSILIETKLNKEFTTYPPEKIIPKDILQNVKPPELK